MTEKIDKGSLIVTKGFQLKNYTIENLHNIANKNFPIMIDKVLLKFKNRNFKTNTSNTTI